MLTFWPTALTLARWAPVQIENAGAAALNTTCCHRNWREVQPSFRQMTRASMTTKAVPTGAPYISVPARTNVSEIEIVAKPDGSLTASHPHATVRSARVTQAKS